MDINKGRNFKIISFLNKNPNRATIPMPKQTVAPTQENWRISCAKIPIIRQISSMRSGCLDIIYFLKKTLQNRCRVFLSFI